MGDSEEEIGEIETGTVGYGRLWIELFETELFV